MTSAEFTRQYFFGRSVQSEWKVGADIIFRMDDGRVDVQGKILQCDPPHFVRFTWRVDWIEELRHLPDSIVSYKIEPAGEGVVRFMMVEEHPEPIDARLLKGGRSGWPLILSGLKSVLGKWKDVQERKSASTTPGNVGLSSGDEEMSNSKFVYVTYIRTTP